MQAYESKYTGAVEVLKDGWEEWGRRHQLVVLKEERFPGVGGARLMEGKCQAAPFFLLEGGKEYTYFTGTGFKNRWVAVEGPLVDTDTWYTMTNNRCEMPTGESGEELHHRTQQGIK